MAPHARLPDPERQELARRYADQAMDLWRSAVSQGFKDVRFLKTSPALELLRGREDFRRLLAELERNKTSKE